MEKSKYPEVSMDKTDPKMTRCTMRRRGTGTGSEPGTLNEVSRDFPLFSAEHKEVCTRVH